MLSAALMVLAQSPDGGVPRTSIEAKWGDGVTLKHDQFSFNVRGRAQLRAEAIVPSPESTATRLNQVLIRRARLNFTARHGETWTLLFQLAFANLDMESDAPNVLRDAYINWAGLRDLNIRAGQMKVPFDRQRLISSGNQQLIDRSLVVTELNLDRDVGVILRSDDFLGLGGRLSYAAGVMSGDGRNRLGTNVGLLYVGRVQVNPFGKFEDLQACDLERLATPRLSIGLAAAYNAMTVRQRSTFGSTLRNGGFNYSHFAADVLFKWHGFSFEAEALMRLADVASHGNEWSRSGWGYFVQAGYSPITAFEVSARWGQLRPFGGTDPSFQQQRELGGGVGWFPVRHSLKLQGDFFWLPTGQRFDVGTWQARVQLQLGF